MSKQVQPAAESSRTKTLYVGVDPGQKGAFAVIHPGGRVESWHVPLLKQKIRKGKTKTGKPRYKTAAGGYNYRQIHMFFYQLRKLRDKGVKVIVGVERQGWRPTDAKNVVFACGANQMFWTALAGANGFVCKLVPPSQWKPLYLPTGADKEASRQLCLTLYPSQPLPLKKDEARAEATLIADYMRRKDKLLTFPRKRPTREDK